MNDIKPTYITFEQAKWLKIKKFTVPTVTFYLDGKPMLNHNKEPRNSNVLPGNTDVGRPEQWQVVEWLRVNHALWIYVIYEQGKWHCNIQDITHTTLNEEDCRVFNICMFNSPQEAYSAAFDYIKDNNLI